MTQKKTPYLQVDRISKDERTHRVAREITRLENSAREEKTERLRAARLRRDVHQQS